MGNLGNLVVNLIANTKGFSGNIKESTLLIKNLKAQADKLEGGLKSGIGTITKFVPQLAAIGSTAALASDAFDKINNGSLAFSDGLDKLKTLISTVDSAFWQMVASGGSFTTFILGLGDIKAKAKEASIALDNLGSADIFSKVQIDYFKSKANEEKALAKIAATEKEKVAHLNKAEEYMKAANNATMTYSDAATGSAIANLNKVIASTQLDGFRTSATLSQEDIEKNFLGVTQEEASKIAENFFKEWNAKVEALNKEKHLVGKVGAGGAMSYSTEYTAKGIELKKDLLRWLDDHPLEFAFAVANNSNELEQANGAVRLAYTNILKYNERLATQQAEIAERANIINKVSSKQPTQQLTRIDLTLSRGRSIEDIERLLSSWNTLYKKAGDEAGRTYALAMISKYLEELRIMQNGGEIQDQLKNAKIELPEFENPYSEVNNELQTMLGNLSAVSSIMGNLHSTFSTLGNTGAAAFTQLLSSVIPLISAIMALTVAEGEEKAARSSKNWIELIAATAAVVSTLVATFAANKNAGKYANGGIVPGNSYSGDKLVANVNSGEMILNRHLQGNLFRMLNTGEGATGGNVTFRISGKDLVGTLNNFNSKYSKL